MEHKIIHKQIHFTEGRWKTKNKMSESELYVNKLVHYHRVKSEE